MRSGDISSEFHDSSRALKGIRGHQALQRQAGSDYQAEVSLKLTTRVGGIDIEVAGRADGISRTGSGTVVEEIKTTSQSFQDLEDQQDPMHWAQAKCYAFMYANANELESIGIRLRYFHIDTGQVKSFTQTCEVVELGDWFHRLLSRYAKWIEHLHHWVGLRNDSVAALEFPFDSYRAGQTELIEAVQTITHGGGTLFAQAPTGIGKTLAVLFPTLQALGQGAVTKVFYLTAKTITRTVVEDSLRRMREKGLRLKSVTITAKDKVCFQPQATCDPDLCEFARGHYDRINEALWAAFDCEEITRDVIEAYATRYRVCPFEYSLDISEWCDCVVCDYNYVFDPRVYLRRYFSDEGRGYAFLIDEAHNLVDRAREMFSAELTQQSFLDLGRLMNPALPMLDRTLKAIDAYLLELRQKCDDDGYAHQRSAPEELWPLLRRFMHEAEQWLVRNEPSTFRDALIGQYFEALSFLRVFDVYDERYATYFERLSRDLRIKLLCLDPSRLLKQVLGQAKSAVFFSATLTPLEYFAAVLGGGREAETLRLPSPFPRQNLLLLLDDTVSTVYRNRGTTYHQIASDIAQVVRARPANYMVYFPSYAYLQRVMLQFQVLCPESQIVIQKPNMPENEREQFLEMFALRKGLVGFAVMGGVFGEGIDLVGDRLSGAIIVGVGLPQISLQQELIRRYFDDVCERGFEYAYTFPGMNKVLQSAGRVIRSERDQGIVLLIGKRFDTPLYRQLLPEEWHPIPKTSESDCLAECLGHFWSMVDASA